MCNTFSFSKIIIKQVTELINKCFVLLFGSLNQSVFTKDVINVNTEHMNFVRYRIWS